MRTWLTRLTAAVAVFAALLALPSNAAAQCAVLNCINGTDALPGQVGGNDNPVSFKGTISIGTSVTLTNAQVLATASSANPLVIVPAPPAGYFIDVIGVSYAFHYVAAYTNGSDIRLFWGNRTSGNAASSTLTVSGFLTGVSGDELVKVAGVPDGEMGPTTAVPLVIQNINGAAFGGGDPGDTLTVNVEYRITKTGL